MVDIWQDEIPTAQKMKFSTKDCFSKCYQIRRKLRIWSHLLKQSLVENFILCAVTTVSYYSGQPLETPKQLLEIYLKFAIKNTSTISMRSNILYTLFKCFYFWLWRSKYRLDTGYNQPVFEQVLTVYYAPDNIATYNRLTA